MKLFVGRKKKTDKKISATSKTDKKSKKVEVTTPSPPLPPLTKKKKSKKRSKREVELYDFEGEALVADTDLSELELPLSPPTPEGLVAPDEEVEVPPELLPQKEALKEDKIKLEPKLESELPVDELIKPAKVETKGGKEPTSPPTGAATAATTAPPSPSPFEFAPEDLEKALAGLEELEEVPSPEKEEDEEPPAVKIYKVETKPVSADSEEELPPELLVDTTSKTPTEELITVEPTEAPQSPPSPTPTVPEPVTELQSRLSKLEAFIDSTRENMEKLRATVENSEESIRKLLGVYELISQRFNPFIDTEGKQQQQQQLLSETRDIDNMLEAIKTPPSATPSVVQRKTEEVEAEEEGEEEPTVATVRAALNELITAVREQQQQQQQLERATTTTLSQQPATAITTTTELQPRYMPPATTGRRRRAILEYIEPTYEKLLLLMRWIEFLFERVKREKITLLLDYYVQIGWISENVKTEVMNYARGEIQDVTKYYEEEEMEEPSRAEDIEIIDAGRPPPEHHTPLDYKKITDWRFSADDHLKSLLFIMKIAGYHIDRDRVNSLEQEIKEFKRNLEGFYGV